MLIHEELAAVARGGKSRPSNASPLALPLAFRAGNRAVASVLAARPAVQRSALPAVQRGCGCGGACGCGSNDTPDTAEQAPTVAAPAEESAGEGGAGSVCLTCTALKAAKGSPGGAIAYVGSRPPRLQVGGGRQVATEPIEEDDGGDGSVGQELASEVLAQTGGGEQAAAGADTGGQAPDEGVASPATRPDEIKPGERAGTPPPVMVPVDASSAGASVVCKGHNSYEVWMNPSTSACSAPCMRKHEEKHIADFNADPNYKATVKCPSLPDGETFTYASDADAKRFECAASDVEIACINDKLRTETDEACKTRLTRRKTVTLPNYKAGFGC